MVAIRVPLVVAAGICFAMGASRAATQIEVPTGFSVPATSSASFTYSGKASPGNILSITVAGTSYLESGPAYGTNAAGVVTVAGVDGNQPVGSVLSCNTINSVQFDCGTLMVSITSGSTTFYGRLFPATFKDGLGKKKPPTSLTFKGSLKKIFGKDSTYRTFKFINPTFSFMLSDSLYSDNTGSFVINNN